MNIIETERLILRDFTPEDAGNLHRIYSDPQTMEFMGAEAATVEETRRGIEKHINTYYGIHGFGLWATVLRENGALIGRCGLLSQEVEGAREMEVSYLLESDYWGRGLAAEAARAILKYGFETYHPDRIIALILPENRNSIWLAERIGMTFHSDIPDYKGFGRVLLYAIDA